MTIPFFIYKLAGFIVTPLGIVLFLLIVAPFWAGKNKKRLFWTLLIPIVFLMIMSMNVTANRMLEGLENISPQIPQDSYAQPDVAVLVLSSGSADNPDGTPTPDCCAISRIVAAIDIAKKEKWPLIFSGGLTSFADQSLAKTMETYARSIGYSGPIILEEKSRTTWENMIFSQKIIKKEGFNKIVLITSSFHMRRALWKARRIMPDIKLYPYPVGPIGDKKEKSPLDWIPTATGLSKSTFAWKEYMGLVVYEIIY